LVDTDFGEILPMSLGFTVVLATAHFENNYFFRTSLAQNGSLHRCTCYQRSPYRYRFAIRDHQYLIQYDFAADVCRYLFYFKFFASDDAILLAAGL